MTRRENIGPPDIGAQLDDNTVGTLEDIIEFADQAGRLVALGRAKYDQDEFLRLAAEAVIHRIGEAVNRLPDRFTRKHPQIPWRAMRGTRNIVSHTHNAIDYGIIWTALSKNLPKDAAQIRKILDDHAR